METYRLEPCSTLGSYFYECEGDGHVACGFTSTSTKVSAIVRLGGRTIDNSKAGIDNSKAGIDNSKAGIDNSKAGIDNSKAGRLHSTIQAVQYQPYYC